MYKKVWSFQEDVQNKKRKIREGIAAVCVKIYILKTKVDDESLQEQWTGYRLYLKISYSWNLIILEKETEFICKSLVILFVKELTDFRAFSLLEISQNCQVAARHK